MLLHAVAGRDERDSTSAPLPVPDGLLHLAATDDEAAGHLRGLRLGLPREYFVAGMEPAWRPASVRRWPRSAPRARRSSTSACRTRVWLATYYIVAPAEASANLARYDGIRFGHAVRDGDVLANYLATRGSGFGPEVKRRIMLGTYALSAGYYDAFYLKARRSGRSSRPTSTRHSEPGSTPWSPRPAPRSPGRSGRSWRTPWRCTSPTPARFPSTWRACRA